MRSAFHNASNIVFILLLQRPSCIAVVTLLAGPHYEVVPVTGGGSVVTLLAGPHYEVVPAIGGGGVVTLLAGPHYEVVPATGGAWWCCHTTCRATL